MSVLQAIFVALLYYLCNSTWGLGVGWWTLMRPLVSGFFTGIILGDPVTGAAVGAQINVLYLGWIGAGGALPSDIALAGVVGTALAITGGVDANTAMALAVPVGLLGSIIWVTKMTLNTGFVRVAERFAAKGDTKKFWIADALLPQLMLFLFSFIPCFILVYFGASHIQTVLQFLGDKVVGVLSIIGGMLPAVGIALTLKSIFKGQSIVFFFLGFLLVQFFHLNSIAIGFLAIVITLIYMQINNQINPVKAENNLKLGRTTESDKKAYVLLDKKTVRRSWFNWIMFNQSNYNYERMQGTGFCRAMLPIIDKLYPNDPEKRAERMNLQMQSSTQNPNGAPVLSVSLPQWKRKKPRGRKILAMK